jgi:hypothetical protein
MFIDRPNDTRSRVRLLSATLTAAAFIIVLMLSGGQAHACPLVAKAESSAGIGRAAARVVLSSVNAVFVESSKPSSSLEHGCGHCAHHDAGGCQVGCCSACTAVISVASPALDLFEGPSRLALLIEDRVVSQIAECQFRPPRLFN